MQMGPSLCMASRPAHLPRTNPKMCSSQAAVPACLRLQLPRSSFLLLWRATLRLMQAWEKQTIASSSRQGQKLKATPEVCLERLLRLASEAHSRTSCLRSTSRRVTTASALTLTPAFLYSALVASQLSHG